MNVRLRDVVPEDRDFLCALYASTREEELAPVPWTDAQKTAFLRSQFEAQDAHYRSSYEHATFQVIEVDGVMAGRLYLARGAEEIRVVDISLLPAFRGSGIGSKLLLDIIARADRAVRIHVERFNPALRLYERLGFRLLEDKGAYLFLERPIS